MSQGIQVHIPEPCHENWQQMTPNEQGRHCLSCQKTVVDFSVMSDKEILNYISTASSQVCGRFANDQLNKDLVMEKKKKFSFAYIWNLLIATFLITGKAYTQGDTVVKKEAVVEQEPEIMLGKIAVDPKELIVPSFVKGMVLDINTGSGIPGASITVSGAKKGVVANGEGNFHIKWPKQSKSVFIEISAIGYKPQTVNINRYTDWKNLEVLLEREIKEMDAVTVLGYEKISRCYTTGTAAYIIRETGWDKWKKGFADWLPGKKEVQVFPNPVKKGSVINLKLNLEETGEYKMELMDASGRVVSVSQVMVTVKDQPAFLPTNSSWGAGIYWVRFTNRQSKKIFQSKVLIQ